MVEINQILDKPFGKTNERNIQIPEGIAIIKASAFQGNLFLHKLSFPNSLEEIEPNAFSNCTNLNKVYFAKDCKIERLPESCFNGCTSLVSIVLPSALKSIDSKEFADCANIKQITIPNNVSNIVSDAFMHWGNNQEIIISRRYEQFGYCQAIITKALDFSHNPDIDFSNEMKYYAVICKCGHVKHDYYIPITFAITARNGKEAAEKARVIPRVKHNHKYAIISTEKITKEEYLEIKKQNEQDPYLHAKSTYQQKEFAEILKDRLEKEPILKPYEKRRRK